MKKIIRVFLGFPLYRGGLNSLTKIVFVALLVTNVSVHAVPKLQIGPDGSGSGSVGPFPGWTYDPGTATWVITGTNNFSVDVTAKQQGNQDAFGGGDKSGYLVLASTPQGSTGDGFDVSVTNATFFDSGEGAPPVTDPNSLAPHGIFDTYFEIYKVNFDGLLGTIYNTEPGSTTDTARGFVETVGVTINTLTPGVTGIHMDLFTLDPDNAGQVLAFAPFSHDGEWVKCVDGEPGCNNPPPGPGPGPGPNIPEPSILTLFAGAMGIRWFRRRKPSI